MGDGAHAIALGWTAVGISACLPQEAAHRAVILDLDMAIWRGRDGRVRVWENRCPHRGMRLSFGIVRGDRLTCIYHGWSYDGEGGCAAIPAHPRLTPPRTITVGRYAAREDAGLIWVATDDVAAPAIEGEWRGCRSITIKAPCQTVLEAVRRAGPDGRPNHDLSHQTVATDVVRVAVAGQPPLLCAVQPVSQDETFLHLAVGVPQPDPSAMVAASDWSKRLRRSVEGAQGGAPAPSSHGPGAANGGHA